MPKIKTSYECKACGNTSPVMVGKCGNCGGFGTFEAILSGEVRATGPKNGRDLQQFIPKELADAEKEEKVAVHALPELNRVLGGGFSPKSVLLLAGEPGVGKSTMALQMTEGFAETLYFSGEESASQIAKRADRLGVESAISTFFTQNLEDIYATSEASEAKFVILDSVQTLKSKSGLGGVSQAREVAEFALQMSKTLGKTILLIGHVTKGGDIAGPRALEHLVDVVLELRGDRTSDLRLLKSPKNRYGSTQETGVFLFEESGFVSVENPSFYFLDEENPAPGTAITTQMEGNRHFFFAVQALSVKTNFGQPRRSASGFDLSRMQLLLAVVERFTKVSVAEYDLYGNVVGGLKIKERSADLSFVLAVLSSRLHKVIPKKTMAIGEVGLSGEVRMIPKLEARIDEAARLGITQIYGPKMTKKMAINPKVTYKEVQNVGELAGFVFSA